MTSMDLKRRKTGLVYDLRMVDHSCIWNPGHPECPDRFTRILARCNELQLIERCHSIPSRPATLSEILLKHTQEHYDILKSCDGETDAGRLEELCTHYDLYIHPSTFQLSLLAVGCAVELVDRILTGEVSNGMAVIRPPGHHAMETQFDGFCFFNNVAIAAQHAISNHNVNRILIVDFDVHHGQGTQQLFYEDPRVLYFSVHGFNHGLCFPGLRESDFDYVGEGRGKGFNFNVPLNKNGMTNADYLAIWQQILLPVAIEYQPELVLVSAGYDAAYGCPLGQMEITPACYAHFIKPLMSLSEGKVAVFLEGGYHLESLAEGAAITLKTLLGDPCPLLEMLDEPSDSVRDSILNCTQTHKAFWKCLQVHREYDPDTQIGDDYHVIYQKFIDDISQKPWHDGDHYNPRTTFPNQTRSKEEERKVGEHLQYLKGITKLDAPMNRTCFGSTDILAPICKVPTGSQMLKTAPSLPSPLPDKMWTGYGRMRPTDVSEHNLDLCYQIETVAKSFSHLGTFHTFSEKSGSSIHQFLLKHGLLDKLHDLKSSKFVDVIVNVLEEKYLNGTHIQLEESLASVSDNAALAAEYATQIQGLKRVLVVDFCKKNHEDNTKQTDGNRSILNVSLDHSNQASFGTGNALAINIPMNQKSIGDYVAVFQRIIMPIAYEFNPQLVLISSDFDAVKPSSSPEIFGYLTHWLSALANGKTILFVKGECDATVSCIKSLLGDPLPVLKSADLGDIESIRNIATVQQKCWKSLKFNKMLPTLI